MPALAQYLPAAASDFAWFGAPGIQHIVEDGPDQQDAERVHQSHARGQHHSRQRLQPVAARVIQQAPESLHSAGRLRLVGGGHPFILSRRSAARSPCRRSGDRRTRYNAGYDCFVFLQRCLRRRGAPAASSSSSSTSTASSPTAASGSSQPRRPAPPKQPPNANGKQRRRCRFPRRAWSKPRASTRTTARASRSRASAA